jgi:ATP/maltotriose-dependent transcriptional regulator MalT
MSGQLRSTCRTHMRNVYGKLGVHSRTDAVKRARASGGFG